MNKKNIIANMKKNDLEMTNACKKRYTEIQKEIEIHKCQEPSKLFKKSHLAWEEHLIILEESYHFYFNEFIELTKNLEKLDSYNEVKDLLNNKKITN